MNTLLWELLVLTAGIAVWLVLSKASLSYAGVGPASRRGLKAQALSEAQAAMLIIGGLAVVGSVAALAIFSTSTVKGCMSNEKAIETALQAYKAAVGSFPATSAAAVKIYDGTTAGTFSNPNLTSTDYLGQLPVDPANPTGTYSLTYVAPTGTTAESYTIVCPGVHTKADLSSLNGASTETTGKIELLSNQGFKAI